MTGSLVRSAQSEEHQYWTDPILCEETRARLEHFRRSGWLPPNFKPRTLQGIAVVERYWRKFSIQSEADYVDHLLREDQAIYMNFFDWMSRTSREKTLQSYDEYWRRLCQYFELFARRRVNEDVHGPFPAERKIPRRTKNKNTLDVDVFCAIYRHHWVHSRFFRHGNMIVQFATVQLWSAITGTRPGVLLPQNTSLPGNPSLGKRKRAHAFESDLPKYISSKDLPDSVCYRDIELFYLKDPQSKRDVLCAIIEFRNLKGRPEGADGTKFFMHGDYQLAYCPIAQIVSFAFRDGAFVNTELTPELIWRLRVPKHTSSLPLRWKPEVLNTPILRRFERTPYGYELHESLSMTYESSRQALKELGRDAKFEDDIGHYNFRRWTANEVNQSFVLPIDVDEQLLGNFTSQERQRVLGQSGDAVFEKHYQSQFIGRDLQHVVLLRPSQEGLIRFAGSMLRKRDVQAPYELSNTHKRAICQNPDLLQLRREKRELGAEMRSLAGSIKKARVPFPHLHQKHENVNKEIAKLRKRLATDTREAARKHHFQNAPVLEIDRQIKQLLGKTDEASSEAPENEDSGDVTWELPTPDYVFAERARLVENFYGPDAENFDEDKLLARRTQVTKDMVALLRLSEPSRRGNRVNWNIGDEDDDLLDPPEESPPLEEDSMNCPTNICIVCCGLSRQSSLNPPPHKFPPDRQDSLRRHLIDTHLQHARNGISCNWKTCRDVPLFSDITKFLAHASTEHSYDIKIKLCHLPQASQTSCSDVSSREASPVSENRQRTETPASSVDLEMKNIDPRLLEAHPVPVAMALQTQPVTEVLSTSGGSSHPNSAETPIRRATRSTAKVTEFAPTPETESQPQYVRRSSRKKSHAEQRVCGVKEKKRLSHMKVPKGPPLRRSKRLRS
ncbi:hypothetical protein N7520_001576 [Penicillium odoratum]|uniref:uncharacterized protein n=1 Tax=Penicillium odoratum TaxID=1167516 RepID=UPI0025479E42|nr:uncharacterized protein N7520_001576 [Penicillium odoratum]KAJ5778330.1 hypothetical protein N7520_001576 [Penicillium odoratum]